MNMRFVRTIRLSNWYGCGRLLGPDCWVWLCKTTWELSVRGFARRETQCVGRPLRAGLSLRACRSAVHDRLFILRVTWARQNCSSVNKQTLNSPVKSTALWESPSGFFNVDVLSRHLICLSDPKCGSFNDCYFFPTWDVTIEQFLLLASSSSLLGEVLVEFSTAIMMRMVTAECKSGDLASISQPGAVWESPRVWTRKRSEFQLTFFSYCISFNFCALFYNVYSTPIQ